MSLKRAFDYDRDCEEEWTVFKRQRSFTAAEDIEVPPILQWAPPAYVEDPDLPAYSEHDPIEGAVPKYSNPTQQWAKDWVFGKYSGRVPDVLCDDDGTAFPLEVGGSPALTPQQLAFESAQRERLEAYEAANAARRAHELAEFEARIMQPSTVTWRNGLVPVSDDTSHRSGDNHIGRSHSIFSVSFTWREEIWW